METVNVLINTFPGLCLPPTICLPLPVTSTTDDLLSRILSILPNHSLSAVLNLTTTRNQPIKRSSITHLADLTTPQCRILPLRLSAPLKGGKGGFGSQLRAAGGRMSSRKKRNNGDPNGSSRNLDGRRLRTITEAKNLAAYLATKPEMDRKEKEERRKRWEAVVELAEKKEDDMRKGVGSDGRRRGLSDEWVESKEEVGEGVRNAVALAMKMAAQEAERNKQELENRQVEYSDGASGGSQEASGEESENEDGAMELDDNDIARLKAEAEAGDVDAIWVMKNKLDVQPPPVKKERKFVGFDEDDEFMSSDDEEAQDVKGKGKARALA